MGEQDPTKMETRSKKAALIYANLAPKFSEKVEDGAKRYAHPSVEDLSPYALALDAMCKAMPEKWSSIGEESVIELVESGSYKALEKLWAGRGGEAKPEWSRQQTDAVVVEGQKVIENYIKIFASKLERELGLSGEAKLNVDPKRMPKLVAFENEKDMPDEGGYMKHATWPGGEGALIFQKDSMSEFKNPVYGAGWLVHEAQHHIQSLLTVWVEQLDQRPEKCPSWLKDVRQAMAFKEGAKLESVELSPSTYERAGVDPKIVSMLRACWRLLPAEADAFRVADKASLLVVSEGNAKKFGRLAGMAEQNLTSPDNNKSMLAEQSESLAIARMMVNRKAKNDLKNTANLVEKKNVTKPP